MAEYIPEQEVRVRVEKIFDTGTDISGTYDRSYIVNSFNQIKSENEIDLFFVVFAIHNDKEWSAHAGYIFAENRDEIDELLRAKYGEVNIRHCEKIKVEKGTILYGERWCKL